MFVALFCTFSNISFFSLLEVAIELKKPEFITQLLRAGARQDVLGEGSGLAPIHLAVLNGDTTLLKLRLKEAVRWAMLSWMMCRRRGELVVVLGAGEGEEEAR